MLISEEVDAPLWYMERLRKGHYEFWRDDGDDDDDDDGDDDDAHCTELPWKWWWFVKRLFRKD